MSIPAIIGLVVAAIVVAGFGLVVAVIYEIDRLERRQRELEEDDWSHDGEPGA